MLFLYKLGNLCKIFSVYLSLELKRKTEVLKTWSIPEKKYHRILSERIHRARITFLSLSMFVSVWKETNQCYFDWSKDISFISFCITFPSLSLFLFQLFSLSLSIFFPTVYLFLFPFKLSLSLFEFFIYPSINLYFVCFLSLYVYFALLSYFEYRSCYFHSKRQKIFI